MTEFSDISPDAAYQMVLHHPYFANCTREDLTSCARFCDVLRNAPIEVVKDLFDALEIIAYETDDSNEASGFLLTLSTFGGGLIENPDPATGVDPNLGNLTQSRERYQQVPVDSEAHFYDWVLSIPGHDRALAHTAAMDALAKRVARLPRGDHSAWLVHHNLFTLLYYGLSPVESLRVYGNYAAENLKTSHNIREQIPDRLWQLFNSRPAVEVKELIEKWWGTKADMPNDFFIALAWQREGHISIHKGKHYHEAVVEYLLHHCEPSDPNQDGPVRESYGVAALTLDPFLEDELYEGLENKSAYRYLATYDVPLRAAYLNELFSAGVLERSRILAALDNGIAKKWDRNGLKYYIALRDAISV